MQAILFSFAAVMAGLEKADLDTSRDDEDGVSYQEMGVDVGEGDQGPEGAKQTSETASQLGVEETDGKATKKRKKAAQRIIQDGECRLISELDLLKSDAFDRNFIQT